MILLFEPDRWGMGLFVRNVGGRSLFQEGRKGRECEEGRSPIVTFYSWSVSARLCKFNFLVVSSKERTSGQTKCHLAYWLPIMIGKQFGVCEYAGAAHRLCICTSQWRDAYF